MIDRPTSFSGMTYQPPPPPPLMYQPPPKPRKTTRTVIIVVAIVLALCCGGAAIGGYFVFQGVSDTVGPPRDAATAYIDDLIEKDYSSAYGRVCGKLRAQVTEAQFSAAMAEQFKVQGYEVTGVDVQTQNGVSTATVTMNLDRVGSGKESYPFELLEENGQWRICEAA
jgi:hypothetical protein